VGAFGAALALSGRAIAAELQSRRPQIEAQLERARAAVEGAGVPLPKRGGSGGSPEGAAQGSAGAVGLPGMSPDSTGAGGGGGSGLATHVLRVLAEGLVGLGLALAFAALGLAEAGEVRQRIAHLGRGGGAAPSALAAIDEAAPAFRRYVWVKSLTSAITGLATWLAALAFGLPLAWVWGFLAFLFEYVPSVGSLLAVIPPTLMALADGGPGHAASVLVVIGALQVILGNVVDPRLEGKLMAVSPFGVLLSIVFWGWLWGAVGALLAVPLTIAIVIACRHIPGARGFATVVAGDGVPDEHE
jgi:AI-2 transport protein TqsA